MRPLLPLPIRVASLLLPALMLGACDAAFDPVTESETAFFAVYGFLDTAADTQFVRVSPLRPLLEVAADPPVPRVSTTLLETGERVAWQDSLVRLDDGAAGLLFFARFRAHPGSRYRLEVRRADDGLTQAVTRVPPSPTLRTGVVTRAPTGDFVQEVTWTGLTRRPADATLRYHLVRPGAAEAEVVTFTFNETGMPAPDGWTFTVNLSQDRFAILNLLDRPPLDTTIALLGLDMEIRERSEEWLRPDAPLNILNGFGFFGAVATFARGWTLDSTATVQVGFALPPP